MCGFIVAAVGIELGLIGVRELLDVGSHETVGRFDLHVGVATLTLMTMVGLAVWGRGILRLLCSLVGILLGFIVAGATGLASASSLGYIVTAPVFAWPELDHHRLRVRRLGDRPVPRWPVWRRDSARSAS